MGFAENHFGRKRYGSVKDHSASILEIQVLSLFKSKDRGLRNALRQRDRCTSVVHRRFEHHRGDSTTWLGFTSILRENNLEVVRGHLSIFSFYQPHERTCVWTVA
ncbi:hypothetical protein TNCV_4133091 [Trichonephila clavipes]|nr:hypothetical protein TNCV_4133091 [Trichonephila clavipes]